MTATRHYKAVVVRTFTLSLDLDIQETENPMTVAENIARNTPIGDWSLGPMTLESLIQVNDNKIQITPTEESTT